MKVITEVKTKVVTTDGKEVHKGDLVVFSAGGRELIGHYMGISGKGFWVIKGTSKHYGEITYNVAPRSIETMYLAKEELSDADNV